MYVCMCLCMFVCMYVSMYLCVCMYISMYVNMCVCMSICVYVCMYVNMCICMCLDLPLIYIRDRRVSYFLSNRIFEKFRISNLEYPSTLGPKVHGGSTLSFIVKVENNRFLQRFVTMDETWVHHVQPEIKQQRKHIGFSHSRNERIVFI